MKQIVKDSDICSIVLMLGRIEEWVQGREWAAADSSLAVSRLSPAWS